MAETKGYNYKKCSAPVPGGCDRPAIAKGLCQSHYQQFRRSVMQGKAKIPTKPVRDYDVEMGSLGPVRIEIEIAQHMERLAKRQGISMYEMQKRIYKGWYEQQRLSGALEDDRGVLRRAAAH